MHRGAPQAICHGPVASVGRLLEQLLESVLATIGRFNLWDVIDILVVALIVYGLISLFRGTTAVTVLYGIGLLLVAVLAVTSLPRLVVLNWLLSNSLPVLSLAILILFQPELRRALDRIGRVRGIVNRSITGVKGLGGVKVVDEIARTCRRLSERRQGALFVLERETGLQEYVETGIEIDAAVSMELLLTVFFPNSPLHDGAVIIRGDRVVAAGCVLPISATVLDSNLGTRHRAAIAITEETDAVTVVVSEETGIISVANNGRLVRHLDETRLKKALSGLLYPAAYEPFMLWPKRRAASGQG